MVNAESGNGQDQPTHSPTSTGSSRPAFGYSPEKPSTDYSSSDNRPAFGLPPAVHFFPDAAIVEEKGPFGLPQREKGKFDKNAKNGLWHKLDGPKRIRGGLRRSQRRRR